MNRRVIGRIISISHNNVVAELYNNLGNYVTLYDGIRFVGEIGSYVAIDDINRRIIAEIFMFRYFILCFIHPFLISV